METDTQRHKGRGMHNFLANKYEEKIHNKKGFLVPQTF